MTSPVRFRRARADDLGAIIQLLKDDGLGSTRESSSDAGYRRAFAEIDADPRHLLVVGELDDEVVACLQATALPCMTHGGRLRAQFEGIRVSGALRGRSVGRDLLGYAIEWARAQGCGVAQLTTDKSRIDAQRFYEALGFVASHEGMKLAIDPTDQT